MKKINKFFYFSSFLALLGASTGGLLLLTSSNPKVNQELINAIQRNLLRKKVNIKLLKKFEVWLQEQSKPGNKNLKNYSKLLEDNALKEVFEIQKNLPLLIEYLQSAENDQDAKNKLAILSNDDELLLNKYIDILFKIWDGKPNQDNLNWEKNTKMIEIILEYAEKKLIQKLKNSNLEKTLQSLETLPENLQKTTKEALKKFLGEITYDKLLSLFTKKEEQESNTFTYSINENAIKKLDNDEIWKLIDCEFKKYSEEIMIVVEKYKKQEILLNKLKTDDLSDFFVFVESQDDKDQRIEELNDCLGGGINYEMLKALYVKLEGDSTAWTIDEDKIHMLDENELIKWNSLNLTDFKAKIQNWKIESEKHTALINTINTATLLASLTYVESLISETKTTLINTLNSTLGDEQTYAELIQLLDESNNYQANEIAIKVLTGSNLNKWDNLDLTEFKAKINMWKQINALKKILNDANLGLSIGYVENTDNSENKSEFINKLNDSLGIGRTYAELKVFFKLDEGSYVIDEENINNLENENLTKWDELDLDMFKQKVEEHKKQTALKNKLETGDGLAELIVLAQKFIENDQEKTSELDSTLGDRLNYNDLLGLFTKEEDSYILNKNEIYSLTDENLNKWDTFDAANFKAKIKEYEKQQTLKEKLENASLKELLKFFSNWPNKNSKVIELSETLVGEINYSDLTSLFDSVDWTVDENVINALSGESLTKWDGLDLTNFKAKIQEWKDEEEKRTTLKETINEAGLSTLLAYVESLSDAAKETLVSSLDSKLGDGKTYDGLVQLLEKENDYQINNDVVNSLTGNDLDVWDELDLTEFKVKIETHKKQTTLTAELEKDGITDSIKFFENLADNDDKVSELDTILGNGISYSDLTSLFDSENWTVNENVINALSGDSLDKWDGLDLTNFKAKIQNWKIESEKHTALINTINTATLLASLTYVESLISETKTTLINTLNSTLGDEQRYAELIQLLDESSNYQANEIAIKVLTGINLNKWDNLDLTEFKAKIETHKKQMVLKNKLEAGDGLTELIEVAQEFIQNNEDKTSELDSALGDELNYNDLLELFTKNSDDTYSLNELAIFSLEGEELTKWDDLNLVVFKTKIGMWKQIKSLKNTLNDANLGSYITFVESINGNENEQEFINKLNDALGNEKTYNELKEFFQLDGESYVVNEQTINNLESENLNKWDNLDLTNFKTIIDQQKLIIRKEKIKEMIESANLNWLVKYVDESDDQESFQSILNDVLNPKQWTAFTAFFISTTNSGTSEKEWSINPSAFEDLTEADLTYWEVSEEKLTNLKIIILKNKLTRIIDEIKPFQDLVNNFSEDEQQALKTELFELLGLDTLLTYVQFSNLFEMINETYSLNLENLKNLEEQKIEQLTQKNFSKFVLFSRRIILKKYLTNTSLIEIIQCIENLKNIENNWSLTLLESITWPTNFSYPNLLNFYEKHDKEFQFNEEAFNAKNESEINLWANWDFIDFINTFKESDDFKKYKLFQNLKELQPYLELVFLWEIENYDTVRYIKPAITHELPGTLTYAELISFYLKDREVGISYINRNLINQLHTTTLNKWNDFEQTEIIKLINNEKESIMLPHVPGFKNWKPLINQNEIKNLFKATNQLQENEEHLWRSSLFVKKKSYRSSLIWVFQFKNKFLKLKISPKNSDNFAWPKSKNHLQIYLEVGPFNEINNFSDTKLHSISAINKKRKKVGLKKISDFNSIKHYSFKSYLKKRVVDKIKQYFFN